MSMDTRLCLEGQYRNNIFVKMKLTEITKAPFIGRYVRFSFGELKCSLSSSIFILLLLK